MQQRIKTQIRLGGPDESPNNKDTKTRSLSPSYDATEIKQDHSHRDPQVYDDDNQFTGLWGGARRDARPPTKVKKINNTKINNAKLPNPTAKTPRSSQVLGLEQLQTGKDDDQELRQSPSHLETTIVETPDYERGENVKGKGDLDNIDKVRVLASPDSQSIPQPRFEG